MSFNDQDDMLPRNAPQPAPFIEAKAKPTVPEVSLLFDKETPNQHTNSNPLILKGSPPRNTQQNKINTHLTTTPTEPYNTWRWKNLSRQNVHLDKNISTERHKKTLMVNNQHRDDSNVRSGFQLHNSVQQRNLESQSRPNVNFENHYNYQNNELIQSNDHQSYGFHNTPNQLNYFQLQPEPHYICNDSPTPANSAQHYLSKQRIHSNTAETILDFNKKSSQQSLEQNRFEVAGQNYHVRRSNESQMRGEHQFDRKVNRFTDLNEDLSCERDFNSHGFQEGSNFQNRLGCSSHDFYNGHDHNRTMTHHGFSNIQRCTKPMCNIKHSVRCCDSISCTQTENQVFIKEMINIIQTQNIQILRLQDQVKQLIQLHSNCHKIKDRDLLSQYDPYNMGTYSVKGRRTKGFVSENLPVIEEHSITHSPKFQNEHSADGGEFTNEVSPIQQNSNKVDFHRNCNCDCNKMSSSTKMSETSPKNSNSPKVGCNSESSPSEQRKSVSGDHTNHNGGNAIDKSFTLNEADLAIGTIAEQAPSPTSSVHVDMQEYYSSSCDDSDSSDSSTEQGDSAEPQVGWTFYNNVLGQVNNILNKNGNPSKSTPDSFDAVQNTIEHFRKLGISFTDVDNTISKKVTFEAKNTPQFDMDDKNETDVTTHFNALAMHCLKDELGTRYPDKMQDFMMCNVASGNANLSFATLRYLERYQLLPKNQEHLFQQAKSAKESKKVKKMKKRGKSKREVDPTWYQSRKPTTKSSVASKILDITTLKQQPKLL